MTTRMFLGLVATPKRLYRTLRGMPFYFADRRKIRQQMLKSVNAGGGGPDFPFGKSYPILTDKFAEAGCMSGDYFHQDLFVARKICEANPDKHVDIGSRIDGFVAHVAAFRKIEIFDIREQASTVKNIAFKQADLMELPKGMENYCDSISSLHAIEHFGLGRYGDPVDYNGHIKAIKNITAILKPHGTFYFSVPIGRQRIEFNAHRVFSVQYLWNLLKDDYDLVSFSYVDVGGDFHEDVPFSESIGVDFTKDYMWGCGIFELRKK
jgi:SAM-dependent methyltransferase